MSKLTKEDKLLKIQSLQQELNLLNVEDSAIEEPVLKIDEKEQEEDEAVIQKIKPKKILSEKQKEALKKGTAAIRRKQAEMKIQKQEQAILDKEILNKKLVEKAIKIKKKQIKQNKILYESESESEEEAQIQKPIKPKPKPEPITTIKSRFKFIN